MLPDELLRDIFVAAAAYDARTAHALAYVSRYACTSTRRERWRSVVVTTPRAFAALLRTVHHAHSGVSPTPLSLGDAPAHCTCSLFVDTSMHPGTDLLTYLDGCAGDLPMPPSALLSYFVNIEVLSLGAAELQVLARSMQCVSPYTLTLVFDGNEELLRDVFGSYTVPSSRSDPGEWQRHAPRLRRRLRHLHVVGVDPQSELTGLPMPIGILEPLRAGSLRPGGFLHAYAAQTAASAEHGMGNALSPDDWSPGVTHMRYDTRKFSYRPAEIFASRLQPFFQQVGVRNGGPHALRAPTHALLGALGVGAFARLDIAWRSENQDAKGTSREHAVEAQRVRLSSALYTGGWPQELRGAWTDRGQPHASAHEAFRYELKEAISNLYGWHVPGRAARDPIRGAYVDRILAGFNARDREACDQLAAVLAECATAQGAAPVPVDFHVHVPSTFVALGEEQAALLPEDRLALFRRGVDAARGAAVREGLGV
ncbi:hypothetical protein MSPP1_003727 [Malassezia sp. CBS 17886]|nr:hypothetical protein MSPP1_003727 [Malassezia sp. CBS 17886]